MVTLKRAAKAGIKPKTGGRETSPMRTKDRIDLETSWTKWISALRFATLKFITVPGHRVAAVVFE